MAYYYGDALEKAKFKRNDKDFWKEYFMLIYEVSEQTFSNDWDVTKVTYYAPY